MMKYRLEYVELPTPQLRASSTTEEHLDYLCQSILDNEFAVGINYRLNLIKVWSEQKSRFLTRVEVYSEDSEFNIENYSYPEIEGDMVFFTHDELQIIVHYLNREWNEYNWNLIYNGIIEAPF